MASPGKKGRENSRLKKGSSPKTAPGWRHYGEKKVAPLRRKITGTITPEIRWLLYAENEMAPLRRKLTSGL
jgi:hypothetical protein